MSSFVSHGMDPVEVQDTGRFLQAKAADMESLIGDINSRVSSSTWNGPDADKFKGQWWPDHQARLRDVAKALHGLGQSALNNAEEQLDASGGRTPSGGTVIGTPGGGGSANGEVGAPSDPRAIPPGRGAGAIPDWFKPHSNRDYAYQCTDWVRRRREALGFGPTVLKDGRWGNGAEMAAFNGGTADTPPSFGAIASYGSGAGHVMIVEDVLDDGNRIRVSEMNTGRDWEVGNPDEFRADRYFVRTPNGWVREEDGTAVGIITFAK